MDQYQFDVKAADHATMFFSRCLRHVKGRWAGQPFTLLPWQEKVVRDVFGWKRPDGYRRYRTLYIEMGRKNAKTTLGAGIALYLLFGDQEYGAEVYSCAADRFQAAICFDIAAEMVRSSPLLSPRAVVQKRQILYGKTASSYRVLSADVPTKHGLNASGIVFDELHAQKTRNLWDVMVTSTGARREPLIAVLTTAGWDRATIGWEVHEYARQVAAGIIEDPSFYPVIFSPPTDVAWDSPQAWASANPSLGETISEEYLRGEAERARRLPAYQNTFRRLHLCQWVGQERRWLDPGAWNGCNGLPVAPVGPAYGGLDLASTSDLAAFVLLFPPAEDGNPWSVLAWHWVPEEAIWGERRAYYEAWVRDGHLRATPGNQIDYATIRDTITDICGECDVQEIGYDRWGAVQLVQELTETIGVPFVPMGQDIPSMATGMRELSRLVTSGLLAHGGNPVLAWEADNLAVRSDHAGRVAPDKKRSGAKIDGMVALVMALDRAIRHIASPADGEIDLENGGGVFWV